MGELNIKTKKLENITLLPGKNEISHQLNIVTMVEVQVLENPLDTIVTTKKGQVEEGIVKEKTFYDTLIGINFITKDKVIIENKLDRNIKVNIILHYLER